MLCLALPPCLKVQKLHFRSEFSLSKITWIFLIFFSLKNKSLLRSHTENLAKWTVSYPPGFDSRYRLHKKAKFCSFMTFSQIAPFFMSHYGNFWTKKNKISARNCEIFWQIRLPKMSLLRLMTLGLPTPANSFHDYETLIYFLNQGQRIVLIV